MSNAQFFNLAIPAPKRLAMMRDDAFAKHPATYPHCPESIKPATWRNVRGWTLANWESAFATLDQGSQDGAPIWYCHTGEQFRNERDAHDIVRSLDRGWFTDEHGDETAVGIVASLPHGRFLAGYRWTSNDERVYFAEVFDDKADAARMADEHARVFAETSREWDERSNAAHRIECDIEEAIESLGTLRLDHSAHIIAKAREFGNAHGRAAFAIREQVAEVISSIREKRVELATYSDVL